MKQTPLHEIHCSSGAKLTEFGGWEMPVRYSGINDEHRSVRSAAGLFDTSHMGEIEVGGDKAREFLQRMTPNDLDRIDPGGCLYSALLNEQGGVIDDLLIYDKGEDRFLLCVNASNTGKDIGWLKEHADSGAKIEDVSDCTAMLSLQGPESVNIMSKLARGNISGLPYFHFINTPVGGVDCLVSRTGYTGEDGFELFCPADLGVRLWEKIIEAGKGKGVVPAGLGARDTLRIEMGYSLYGAELDEEHTPLESGISWICRWDKGEFIGREKLVKLRDEGTEKTIVGIEMMERGVPRHGYPVYDGDEEVGEVTSGTMSPTLNIGVALARINRKSAKIGKELDAIIHGRPRKTKVIKLPFVEQTSLERSGQ